MKSPRITMLAVAVLALAGCASAPRPRYISDIVREAQASAERMTRSDVDEILATSATLRRWQETATEEERTAAAVAYAVAINPGLLAGGTGMSPEDCAWLMVYRPWADTGTCEPQGPCNVGLTAYVGPPPAEQACSAPECAGRSAIAYQDWQDLVWRYTEIWRSKAALCKMVVDGWWNFGAGGTPPLSAYDELDVLREGGR